MWTGRGIVQMIDRCECDVMMPSNENTAFLLTDMLLLSD